ncbi:hypothetical protein [Muricoccus vinaceus]|uniref:Uncharacterized protein n=1 Tax=Muricoccus vinaceus TaxID=424704 RepID=A0ABV6ITY7_9PROT
MRLLPVLAALAASMALTACTLNTAPANPPPSATVITPAPAPAPMMMAPAPSSPAVIVR